jgi:hypothetical protein
MEIPADDSGRRAEPGETGRPAKAPCVDDTPRLEWLICWYEAEAKKANWWNKVLRITTIVMAAGIPFLVAASYPPATAALLGAAVVALEAIQELFQFQKDYLSFATTKEALKRERALFAAAAGPYRPTPAGNPARLLAERIEALVAAETAGWADVHDGGKPQA